MDEIIRNIEYDVYNNMINIELFNKIIGFINQTNTKGYNIHQEVYKNCIWHRYDIGTDIKNVYQFQYLGELLERYEERFGNDIRDIRAIALAIGYSSNYIESSMIVGTQLVDFINKIKILATNDIYLKAALYLYDNKKFFMYSDELFNDKYTKTEEIIFVMSIFYDRLEDFFKKNRQQIINLLGKNRNMYVFGNVRVYAWVIESLYPIINKDRKKDIAVLKALIKVPTGFQKEDTIAYKELVDNVYTREEVFYLNYLLLYYSPVPKSVKVGYSIVEEKIATNLCKVLINSKKEHDKNTYILIKRILEKYNTYQIKCYGYNSIKNALESEINIVNPITFTELYDELNENLFSFNILDEKWDIVADKMESTRYQKLFDSFLLYSEYNKEKVKECIIRYNDLTHKNYINSFVEYYPNRSSIFKRLVENNVILLKDVYKEILKCESQNRNSHLKEYIKGIYNKKSFEFLKYILRLNKYSIDEISDLGFNFNELLKGYKYSKSIDYLNIHREFFSIKDYRIIFDCIERFVFYKMPELYIEFMREALSERKICKIYKKEKLRKIYFMLCKIDPNTFEKKLYQEKYLTTEELEEIRERKRIEKEMKNKKEMEEAEEYINSKFLELDDRKSFKAFHSFCCEYNYKSEYLDVSARLSKKYILDNINIFSKDIDEILEFVKFIKYLIEKNKITAIEFRKIASEYLKEEEKSNEYINTTFGIDN